MTEESTTASEEDNPQSVSVSRVIDATPEQIFAVLTDPRKHPVIDGSGSVKGDFFGPEQLTAEGQTFGMKMKLYGIPYRMKSTVMEYDENKRIAWAHFHKHRWRYELEPVEGGTKVTETFDWSTAISPKGIEKMGYPKSHPPKMEATLENLADYLADEGS